MEDTILSSIKDAKSLFSKKATINKKLPPAFNGTGKSISLASNLLVETLKKFTFRPFYHPYAELLLETLNRSGFKAIFDEALLDKSDRDANGDGTTFKTAYVPDTSLVQTPLPAEEFSFSIDDPYAQVNWMTHYLIVTLIVETLMANNQNDAAIEFIKNCLYNSDAIEIAPDPKHPNPNAKYWKLPIFKDEIAKSTTDFFSSIADNTLQEIMNDLEVNPFNPFVVAYRRPQEFMMYVVSLYIKALIAQGDVYFRMAYNGGGMDYLNLALEYYKGAKINAGEKIETIPNLVKKKPESYQSLKDKGLSPDVNALVQFENIFPFCSQNDLKTGDTSPGSLLGGGLTFYFSIPADTTVAELQDKIDDRLFKLRNCEDIDGIIRKIDLFGTKINPDQLLAALAKGLTLNEILGSLYAPPPLYKVSFNIQKSKEVCTGELRAIGQAIVSAIEKGETEELALLASQHETNVINRLLPIKEKDIYQALVEKEVLKKAREAAVDKLNYYQSLLGFANLSIPEYKDFTLDVDSRSKLPDETQITPSSVSADVDMSLINVDDGVIKVIPLEQQELDSMATASDQHQLAASLEAVAAYMNIYPNFSFEGEPFGIGGSTSYGASNLAAIPSSLAKGFQSVADTATYSANLSAKYASYARRENEWAFLANVQENEIVATDLKLNLQDIKTQILTTERDNILAQRDEAQSRLDYRTQKISNYMAYQQMVDKLKSIHKNYYDLAMYYARCAEQAYQFEKPEKVIDFISYNYDDSFIGCSTVAEELIVSLSQMEKSYLGDTVRPLEMKFTIQLSRLNPEALLKLRKTGKADFDIPEWFLLLKNRGIYNAKWISMNFNFPMITSPFINMNALITMQNNFIRIKPNGGVPEQFAMKTNQNDDRFVQINTPFKEILISTGLNDSGYNLDPSANANEVYQQQYHPFEHAGVISGWSIDLNNKGQSLDYSELNWDTLSDVIITGVGSFDLDNGQFQIDADNYLTSLFSKMDGKTFYHLIDIKRDLPNDVYKFKNDSGLQNFAFNIDQTRLPYLAQNKKLTVANLQVITKDNLLNQQVPFKLQGLMFAKSGPPIGDYQVYIVQNSDGSFANMNVLVDDNPTEISLKLSKENFSDSYIILQYTLN